MILLKQNTMKVGKAFSKISHGEEKFKSLWEVDLFSNKVWLEI